MGNRFPLHLFKQRYQQRKFTDNIKNREGDTEPYFFKKRYVFYAITLYKIDINCGEYIFEIIGNIGENALIGLTKTVQKAE